MRFDGWSLDPSAWTRVAVILRGTRWQRVRLDPLYRESVPLHAGIYLLTTENEHLAIQYGMPDVLANAVYVGRSDKLRNRFLQHAKSPLQNPLIQRSHEIFGRLDFVFSPVPKPYRDCSSLWLNKAESELVQVLCPPANRSVPRSKPIVAQLGPPQRI